MSRIFLLHSSMNDTEAIDIRDWIEANGWAGEVFLDLDPERGLVAGVKWEAALKQALAKYTKN